VYSPTFTSLKVSGVTPNLPDEQSGIISKSFSVIFFVVVVVVGVGLIVVVVPVGEDGAGTGLGAGAGPGAGAGCSFKYLCSNIMFANRISLDFLTDII
jgi:hypothetical protein